MSPTGEISPRERRRRQVELLVGAQESCRHTSWDGVGRPPRKVTADLGHPSVMDLMALPELRQILFELMGPALRPDEADEFDAEWARLHRKAARLGLEVLECEDAGVSYAAAARRPGDWPILARAHYGIFDLLQDEVPRELLAHLRVALERARALDREGFGQDLLVVAAHDRTAASAVVRFAIYQIVRLNLWLLTWDLPRLEAVGAMAEIDREAQRILDRRLGESSTFHPSARPLVVLIAEALTELVRVAQDKEEWIIAGGAALRSFHEGLTDAARLARDLCAADADILRNEYAEHVYDERLESIMLAERHPRVLRSQQAVDTRRCRLLEAVRSGRVVRRRMRFVDVVRDVYLGIGGPR